MRINKKIGIDLPLVPWTPPPMATSNSTIPPAIAPLPTLWDYGDQTLFGLWLPSRVFVCDSSAVLRSVNITNQGMHLRQLILLQLISTLHLCNRKLHQTVKLHLFHQLAYSPCIADMLNLPELPVMIYLQVVCCRPALLRPLRCPQGRL